MKVHLIAIGGAVMHNMALALKEIGHTVTGSDDEIRDPSKSRLFNADLLPSSFGWDAKRITEDLDAVILGMHAREDNPELLRTQELGIPLYSFPEFIYERSINKTRVVIAGSHGKTTTTSMVMHALRRAGKNFDYLVGAQLEGFETMVRISDAPIIVIEGDEYLSSPIDRRPKFLHYKANVLLITGIAWDHINVFPTFDFYLEQFRELLRDTPEDASIFWYEDDEHLRKLSDEYARSFSEIESYGTLKGHMGHNGIRVEYGGETFELSIFGEYNLANCYGAMKVCSKLGVPEKDFLRSMRDFKGAALRMEKLLDSSDRSIYRDFAHAPSKVRASIKALSARNQGRRTIAVLELHTFSSLNKKFMVEYKASLDPADTAIIYYSPKTIEHKKLEPVDPEDVKSAFGNTKLLVITESSTLKETLMQLDMKMADLILMSSGNFGGLKIPELVEHLKSI